MSDAAVRVTSPQRGPLDELLARDPVKTVEPARYPAILGEARRRPPISATGRSGPVPRPDPRDAAN